MKKNIKQLFFLTTLVILLVGLTAISATDVSDNNTVSDAQIQAPVTTTSMDNVETVQDDNKIVQSTKSSVDRKTVKSDKKSLSRDSGEIDYYVSNSGRDTNAGTKDKPYKTINKALTQTKADNTYNIYLASGTYKGKGNTNLTINGNYNINLIGEGVNKTVIDGEVKWSFGRSSVWGYDPYFNYYTIKGGNYAMSITNGTGHISLSNMNIQHMLADGGSSISSNPRGGITNFGNLSVDNVYFYQNLGGTGASIQNKNGATLTVNNSIFQENRKASSTGCYGSGIYNNGTALAVNSQFINNIGRWGVVTNDKLMDIVNCSFIDGKAYTAKSTFKFGSGVASNTGAADYFNPYVLKGVVTHIFNSTFINNGQTDIYSDSADLIVSGCSFINGTGIFTTGSGGDVKVVISNSTFRNMTPSNLFGSLSVKTGTTFAIYSSGKYDTTIENNVIDFSIPGYGMYLNGNSTVRNNSLNKYIYAVGNSNNITNNTINTSSSSYAVELVGRDDTVVDNVLYSHVFYGDKAVLADTNLRRTNNIVKDNTPVKGMNINLTDDNYSNYFDNSGLIKTDSVENGSTIIITGDIHNKNFTFANIKVALQGQASIINGSLNVVNNSAVIMNGTTINNNNQNAITLDTPGNRLTNVNIIINATSPVNAVSIQKDNNILNNNTITITSTVNSIAVNINSSNNDLRNIRINSTTNSVNSNTESIGILLNNTENNYIKNSTTYLNSTASTTGYKLINSTNSDITGDILVYKSDKAVGVELTDSGSNTVNTYASINNANTGYGIIARGNKTLNTNNFFGRSNSITANTSVGILLLNATNTNITSTSKSSITRINSDNARGVLTNNTENIIISYQDFQLLNASNTTKTDIIAIEQINSANIEITAITMKDYGISNKRKYTYNEKSAFLKLVNTTNTTVNNGISEEGIQYDTTNTNITTDNTAIIMENSDNNTVNDITIHTKTDYTMILNNSNNNTITRNLLNGNNIYGGDVSVHEINTENNTVENNTHDINVIITDDNYNNYFENGTFILKGVLTAEIGSDLYNKNMTFPTTISINNPGNYTIYNGTITLLNNTKTGILSNLNFNANDERTTVLNITSTSRLQILNTTIKQYNNEKIAQSVQITPDSTVYIRNMNITLQAPESNSNNTQTSMAINTAGSTVIEHSNININTTKTVENGKITAVAGSSLYYSNIILNAKNQATGILSTKDYHVGTVTGSIIKISGNNTIAIYSTETSPTIDSNTIELNGKNNTIYIQKGILNFNMNNITSNGNTQVIFDNLTGGTRTDTGLSNGLNCHDNNITVENQENTILLKINNSQGAYIYSNNITINSLKNNTIKENTPLIGGCLKCD